MTRSVRFPTLIALTFVCGAGMAQAQTPASASTSTGKGYAVFDVAATLGHKSDSSFGGEAGYKLMDINSPIVDELYVFVEGGRMNNVATSDIDARALLIANGIGASVSTTQEARYFDAGLKFRLMPPLAHGAWRSYVLLGVGAANVRSSANFAIGGNDITSRLDTYGVSLGNDLSSSITKTLLTIGVGANAKYGKRLLVDVSYRYGRIFPKTDQISDDVAISTQRLQAGVGIRF